MVEVAGFKSCEDFNNPAEKIFSNNIRTKS